MLCNVRQLQKVYFLFYYRGRREKTELEGEPDVIWYPFGYHYWASERMTEFPFQWSTLAPCSITGPVCGASWSVAPAQTGFCRTELCGIPGMCFMGNAWAIDLAQPETHLCTGHWPKHLSCSTSAPAADIYIYLYFHKGTIFRTPFVAAAMQKPPPDIH